MFKKILICAVSVVPLAPLSAAAGSTDPYWRHTAYPHATHERGHHAWHGARPAVVRGYYPGHYAHGALRYGWPHRFGLPSPYRLGYGVSAPVAPVAPAFAAAAALPDEYRAPFAAFSPATALVPVTTLAPVPVRVYYIPQQQPYYNVPPYAVAAPCFCD